MTLGIGTGTNIFSCTRKLMKELINKPEGLATQLLMLDQIQEVGLAISSGNM